MKTTIGYIMFKKNWIRFRPICYICLHTKNWNSIVIVDRKYHSQTL